MRNKVPAFTLFELILGMLLSAVVIGMVYNAWFLFSRVYRQYMIDATTHSEILLLKKVLSTDVENAALVQVFDNEVVLLDSVFQERQRYMVIDIGIVRKGLRPDTFSFGRVAIEHSFEGEKVADSLADELSFHFLMKGKPISVSVAKYYSSVDLFKTK